MTSSAPGVSLAMGSPSTHPRKELLGGCLGQVSGTRYLPRSSLAINAAQDPWFGLGLHTVFHSAETSCLPQFMTVKPTSSNSCFPFSVFLLQNCSGENAVTLTYLLPNSNNYLCTIKPLWSVTHPTWPTVHLTADSGHHVTSFVNTSANDKSSLFTSFCF